MIASPEIPYGRHDIDDEDVRAVVEVLRSDWLTQGPMVPRFEDALAAYCGAAHGVATSSGTAALHLACLALDVGPDAIVWTSPITFVASANCVRYCGARVDFVDIDPGTWTMSMDALAEKLKAAEADGCLPNVVIPVHLGGASCDMVRLSELASEYGFRTIEDAAHALGGEYRGEPIGRCAHSDIAVFSFHPVKSITTGEGGMAVTGSAKLAERMALLRAHGRDVAGRQVALGFNYRLTDIQAALGLAQLRRLDHFVAERARLAGQYDAALSGLGMRRPTQSDSVVSANHLYVVRVPAADRLSLVRCLTEAGVATRVHYPPVHLQPYYREMGFREGLLLEAERYGEEALTLPLFPTLGEADQAVVISACRSALET